MIEINNRFECDHSAVYPFLTDGSGYVEGRCGACGEEGFVYRDPAYEAWKASDDAPRCGTFIPPTFRQRLARWWSLRTCKHKRRTRRGRCLNCNHIEKQCNCQPPREACAQCPEVT